ncbi:Transmembrane protein -like protein [Toxocara canis]|uniref:Transmembrane protein-like protein n=1 Tax=Toxocara canis TaxID=6265 RepID=A0A0B2W552_TOXCA|nr:Transmembrane protein -like protein [Toxocara canis]
MAVASTAADASYPTTIGYMLIFNLIVGTGALALPKAFHSAGYGLGVLLLLISSFMSYVCATFVVEGMAIANAAIRRDALRTNRERSEKQISEAYAITKRVEVSTMAGLFMGKYGVLCLNSVVTVYLFGDLARITVYRLAICAFVCFVTPMVLIGVHRTKYLQLSTSACRWTAFALMIVLACIQLVREGSPDPPQVFNIHGFGSLFGTTVYAFMCHHSLPSLITPMKSKRHVFFYLILVYALVLTFYLALAISGTFSFEHIFDVYSLNFLHNKTDAIQELFINYFLALFPVFTLTSNYPIVACTLVNNLTVLVDLVVELFLSNAKLQLFGSSAMGFSPDYVIRRYTRRIRSANHPIDEEAHSEDETFAIDSTSRLGRLRHHTIALVVVASATLIAVFTDNVLVLTSITGSYPGVGVQYIIPSLIAIYGRRFSQRIMGAQVPRSTRSPFSSSRWPKAMLLWSAFTVLMVTLNLVMRSPDYPVVQTNITASLQPTFALGAQ